MAQLTRRAFVGSAALAALLAGCGNQAQSTGTDAAGSAAGSDATAEPADTGSAEATIVGGWQVNAEATVDLTEEEAAVWAALDPALDVDLEPVSVLATQVVAGTNYAFLVKETSSESVGSDEPDTTWTIAVVYQDLEGACELMSTKALNPANLQTAEDTPEEGLAGGWAVAEKQGVALLPTEAQEAFDYAAEHIINEELNPIATLATQLVAGTNYLILCEGTPVQTESAPQLYAATCYVDLEGLATITDVLPLDLLAYV